MATARTFGSYSFTCAPHRLDRTALENERALQERVRRYGQQEPPAMAQYRAMEPDETVAQLQELEHQIWALGRDKRRMDSAEFVKRLAQSSMAHKARVAGRSRRHARNRDASARFDEGEEDAARDALLLEEELEKLDDGLWDTKVKQRAARRSSDRYQVERKRWHQQRLEHQMIRDERSDPAFRRPRPMAWADNRPQVHQPSASAHRAREPAWSTVHGHATDLRRAGAQGSDGDVGVVGCGAHWVGSEPSAQAELLALRHSIEVQQMRAHQMLQELQARQVVESELEWQLMQLQERRIGLVHAGALLPDPYQHAGRAAAAWPELPFDDDEAEPYPLDIF